MSVASCQSGFKLLGWMQKSFENMTPQTSAPGLFAVLLTILITISLWHMSVGWVSTLLNKSYVCRLALDLSDCWVGSLQTSYILVTIIGSC